MVTVPRQEIQFYILNDYFKIHISLYRFTIIDLVNL